jgi:transcriptional regulator with XRE-family HTH domain
MSMEPIATPATPGRRPPQIGRQVRRWRTERGLTLAGVAERTGLNVGYLSQIENDKASPSLSCLAALGAALDVPVAWFLVEEATAPYVVRAADRSVSRSANGRARMERVDGGLSRDLSVLEGVMQPGERGAAHSHPGDEHHVILRGRWRLTQGDHAVEVGPGDYIRWDGTVPHDAEVIGDDEGSILIVRVRTDR